MKKSKIIIPALAIIAFSTAASIAGSVAWFTASRTASIDAGTYAVVKTNADLAYDLTQGAGTIVEVGSNGEAISLDGNKLTDGSVNHATKRAFAPNANGTGYSTVAGKNNVDLTAAKAALEPNLERGSFTVGSGEGAQTKKIYTAATWEVKFTVSFGGVPGDVGLFLNCHDSSFTSSSTSTDSSATTWDDFTALGFRLAFMPKAAYASNAEAKVVAPLQLAAKCAYVNDSTTLTFPKNYTEGAKYAQTTATEHELIDSTYMTAQKTASTLPADGEATRAQAEARNDYLGTFVYSSGAQVDLEYICVVWFEGTDENIVNQDIVKKYQSVAATLVFDAIDLHA